MSGDCAGQGRCHGCIKWCYACDDVSTTCDAEQCDQHRCARCNVLLTHADNESESDWHKWCLGCHETSRHEKWESSMLAFAAAGCDEVAAQFAALLRGGFKP